MEGGIRANVACAIPALFEWLDAHALFGQSYHLGGLNSFTLPDIVNVGASSGLETNVSDYVGMLGITLRRALLVCGARAV